MGTTLVGELEDAALDASNHAIAARLEQLPSLADAYDNRAARLRARAERVRESLASIKRASETPQNRAVKAWLLDLAGDIAATPPETPGDPQEKGQP